MIESKSSGEKKSAFKFLAVISITAAGAYAGNLPFIIYLGILNKEISGSVNQYSGDLAAVLSGLPVGQQLFFIFFPFMTMLTALVFSYRLILKKRPSDVIGLRASLINRYKQSTGFNRGRSVLRWSLVLKGFLVWIILAVLVDAVQFVISKDIYDTQIDLLSWLRMNFWLILFIPFQTAAEEAFFRGFIISELGLWKGFRKRAIFFSAVLFALLHIMNSEVSIYGFYSMMPQYLIMALFLGYITMRDKGLERAWGVHMANNWYGLSIVNIEGSTVETDSLFVLENYNPFHGLIFLGLSVTIFLFIMLRYEKIQDYQEVP